MAVTFSTQQVIEIAQEHEPMDPTRGIQLLNQTHLYITSQLHLVPDQTTSLSLVAGQQEYSLPDSVVTIWDASYLTSSSAHKPLKATNVDTLFEDRGPNWQLQPSGEPWAFYERGGMIGFVPAPSLATSGGYPSVTLFYTPATSLGLGDTLPTMIPSPYAWVYGMCERACVVSAPEKLKLYQDLFESEMHRLREYVYGRLGRDRARVSYRVKRVRKA